MFSSSTCRVAGALAALAGCASIAVGQGSIPRFFVWDNIGIDTGVVAPTGWGADASVRGIFIQNMNGEVNEAGAASGRVAALQFAKRVRSEHAAGRAAQGSIAVLLSDFGQCGPTRTIRINNVDYPYLAFAAEPEWQHLCIFDGSDLLPESALLMPAVHFQHPVLNTTWRAAHPWMTATRSRLSHWMADFCDEYRHLARYGTTSADPLTPVPELAGTPFQGNAESLHVPPIDRFLFDMEIGTGPVDDIRKIRLAMLDPRWNTEQVPGQPPGTTMAGLLTAAVPQLSGLPGCNPVLPPSLWGNVQQAWFQTDNRPLVLWYSNILFQSLYASQGEVYDVIRSTLDELSPTGTPPMCFNYGDHNADGATETYGWFQDQPILGASGSNTLENSGAAQAARVPARQYPRLSQGFTDQVSRNIEYPGVVAAGNESRWLQYQLTTSGDADCPLLYAVPAGTDFNFIQKNLYLPGGFDENWNEANLRLARQSVETSIGSTRALGRTDPVIPWIAPPGGSVIVQGSPDYISDRHDVRDLLSMMRAKNATEFLVFGAGLTPNAAEWTALKQVAEQVYDFALSELMPVEYADESWVFDPAIDVSTTLRAPWNAALDMEWGLLSAPLDSDPLVQRTSFECEFAPQISTANGCGLRINLECRVPPTPGLDLSELRGRIWIHSWGPGEWHQLQADDFADGRFGFYTADGSTRRAFEILDADPYFGQSGQVRMRVELQIETPSAGLPAPTVTAFWSYVDLLQLVRTDGANCNASPEDPNPDPDPTPLPEGDCGNCVTVASTPTGPDVNFDEVVDTADLDAFFSQFGQQAPAADYNVDASVDEADVVDFLSDYVGG